MVLILFFFIVGLALVYTVIRIWALLKLREIVFQRWRKTWGNIKSYELMTPGGKIVSFADYKKGTPYSDFLIRVTYKDGSSWYETKNANLWDFLGGHNYASDLRDEFDQHMSAYGCVPVYYSPDEPSVAVILPRLGGRFWYELAPIIAGLVVAFISYVLYSNLSDAPNFFEVAKSFLFGSLLGGLGGIFTIKKLIHKVSQK